jgi:hypothetical protein
MFERAQIGLVCPSFGYPGFLPELVASILDQRTDTPFGVVLVDDCCPDPETRELCNEYAAACPDLIRYIRPKQNGGLSSARNCGIDYLLQTCPELEGLTFVDADDRLFSRFVDRCHIALCEAVELHEGGDTKVGWIFEDPYMIGVPGVMRRLRTHSFLWNLVGATQTSSSIFSAELFRSGLRYSEDMKNGGEDWEFSIRAYKAGFRANYRQSLGLRYRRRPGSMSSDVAANLGMERNRVDIRLRHPDLYKIAPVTEQYVRECSHYCVIDERGNAYLKSGIKEDGKHISVKDLLQLLSYSLAVPGIASPQVFIIANSSFLAAVKGNKRLLDFAALANLFAGGKQILHHYWRSEPSERSTADVEFNRPQNLEEKIDGGASAFSMSRETFISAINTKSLDAFLAGGVAATWTAPEVAASPAFNAYQILQNTHELSRTIWPSGVKPTYRKNEQVWQPSSLNWRDLPAMLTGLSQTFPEIDNRNKILILARGYDLLAKEHLEELGQLAGSLKNRKPAQGLALGIIGSTRIPAELSAYFSDIYTLPEPVGKGDPNRWQDEKLLVSVTSSFGAVVSLDVTRLSNHSPILQKNGVKLFHKAFRNTRNFDHGRTLISMFKSYNGFICEHDLEKSWLVSHGVPVENIMTRVQFESHMLNFRS